MYTDDVRYPGYLLSLLKKYKEAVVAFIFKADPVWRWCVTKHPLNHGVTDVLPLGHLGTNTFNFKQATSCSAIISAEGFVNKGKSRKIAE